VGGALGLGRGFGAAGLHGLSAARTPYRRPGRRGSERLVVARGRRTVPRTSTTIAAGPWRARSSGSSNPEPRPDPQSGGFNPRKQWLRHGFRHPGSNGQGDSDRGRERPLDAGLKPGSTRTRRRSRRRPTVETEAGADPSEGSLAARPPSSKVGGYGPGALFNLKPEDRSSGSPGARHHPRHVPGGGSRQARARARIRGDRGSGHRSAGSTRAVRNGPQSRS